MKRITVTVDEALALEEVIRAEKMRQALDESWNLGEIFSADWLEAKGYVKPPLGQR